MKISFTKILENITSSAVDYPENDRNLSDFLLDQIYLLESGFGNKNNIEQIVANVFSEKSNSEFDELIDIIYRTKNHKIAEKPILQIMHLKDFELYKNENKNDVLSIFKEVDIFYQDSKPTNYLIKSCSNVVENSEERLEKYGCLNYFSQSLHNNYLNILYKQEDLDSYTMKFNKAMTDIYKKIKEKDEKFADQITNIVMIGMNVKNFFELLVNELIAHNNSQAILNTKLFFPLFFSQLSLHYISSQNDIILHILGNIEQEKLSDNEKEKIYQWDRLFLKLRKQLYDASVVGGVCEILNNEGIEVEDLNYFYKKFLQIIQFKIVEIKEIKKHPNSNRLNLCTVFDGEKEREIVCGASNVHKIKDNNLKTILAQTGQIIPNGMILEPKDIRGVVSDGMLCSLEELMADFKDGVEDGIAELEENSILGTSPFIKIMNYFNFSDIADISITPNLGYSLGLLNIEEILKSYLLTDYYNLSSQFTSYLNNKDNKKIFNKSFDPLISIDNEIIKKEVIENIFYSKCSIENYKPLNLSARNLLISHGFEIHNDVRDNFNYSYIMTGFSFHCIDYDKIIGGKLKIAFNENESSELKKGDIIVVDSSANIIAIPGIKDIESYAFDPKLTKNILFFTFLFYENSEANINIGFNRMLKIARRNKLSNNMIYFFERSRINLALLETAFVNIRSQSLEDDDLFFCIDEKINESRNWFKSIKFKVIDIVFLFKKIGLLSYLDSIDENTIDSFIDLGKIGRKCCLILARLGIIDYDLSENSIFEINSNDEDGLYCMLPVFKHRVEINYSMDLVAALYKYFVYEDGLEIFYEGFYEKFLSNEIDYESQNDKEINIKDPYSYITYSNLDREEIDSLDFGDYQKLKLQRNLCERLIYRGYNELCNFSFIDKNDSYFEEKFLVKLSSPVNKNLNTLRSSIFSSLFINLKEISKKYQENIAIFESGPVYTNYNIFQKNIAGMRFGNKFPRNIHSRDKSDFNFFDIKADFLEILKIYNIDESDLNFYRLNDFYDDKKELIEILKERNLVKIIDKDIFDQHKQFFHDGKSAIVFYKDLMPIGYLGEIHPRILQDLEFSNNIVGFVLFCESLDLMGKQKKKLIFQSQYQSVIRDFALIFDERTTISEIKNTIIESNSHLEEKILRDISIFDIYQDEKLKIQNKKSIAFSLKLQSEKQTLSDKIINEITKSILDNLKDKLSGYMIFEENK
jgi:phenylalanyl-tRNA synthetase beta subunit